MDGNVARELQVVELFFEALALIAQILGGLRVLRQAGSAGLFARGGQIGGTHLFQAALARLDVHGEFLKIVQVLLIELLEQGDVLEQRDLVGFQRGGDGIDVHFHLIVARFQRLDLVAAALEPAENPLVLFLIGVKAFQLCHQVGDHLAHFAHVLGAHAGQRAIGKLGDVLLAGAAIGEHEVGIGHVDLLREFVDHLFFFGRKARGRLLVLFHLHQFGFDFRRLGRAGAIERQLDFRHRWFLLSPGATVAGRRRARLHRSG